MRISIWVLCCVAGIVAGDTEQVTNSTATLDAVELTSSPGIDGSDLRGGDTESPSTGAGNSATDRTDVDSTVSEAPDRKTTLDHEEQGLADFMKRNKELRIQLLHNAINLVRHGSTSNLVSTTTDARYKHTLVSDEDVREDIPNLADINQENDASTSNYAITVDFDHPEIDDRMDAGSDITLKGPATSHNTTIDHDEREAYEFPNQPVTAQTNQTHIMSFDIDAKTDNAERMDGGSDVTLRGPATSQNTTIDYEEREAQEFKNNSVTSQANQMHTVSFAIEAKLDNAQTELPTTVIHEEGSSNSAVEEIKIDELDSNTQQLVVIPPGSASNSSETQASNSSDDSSRATVEVKIDERSNGTQVVLNVELQLQDVAHKKNYSIESVTGSLVNLTSHYGEVKEGLPVADLTYVTDMSNDSYFEMQGNLTGYEAENVSYNIAGRVMGRQGFYNACNSDPPPCQPGDACRVVGGKVACYWNHCLGVDCSGRGICIEQMYGHRCVCELGFEGESCEDLVPEELGPCSPSPCQGNCTCVESCKHEYGYYCASTGGFTGKNCTVPVPKVTCGEKDIVIDIPNELYEEFDGGLGNTVFYTAPDSRSRAAGCQAVSSRNGLQITIPLPFSNCGSRTDVNGPTFVVGNRVIADRENAAFSVETPIVDFQCIYQRQYKLITSMKPVVAEPVSKRGYGKFTPTVELCKTTSCPAVCPLEFSVSNGAIYTVGEVIHMSVSVLPADAFFDFVTVISAMYLSCEDDSSTGMTLVEDGCPAQDELYVSASTGRVACVSMQTPRSDCPTFYIHLHLTMCPETELTACPSGDKLRCSSGRVVRSVRLSENTVDTMVGPITVIHGVAGIEEIELYPGASNESFLIFNPNKVENQPAEDDILENILLEVTVPLIFLVLCVTLAALICCRRTAVASPPKSYSRSSCDLLKLPRYSDEYVKTPLYVSSEVESSRCENVYTNADLQVGDEEMLSDFDKTARLSIKE